MTVKADSKSAAAGCRLAASASKEPAGMIQRLAQAAAARFAGVAGALIVLCLAGAFATADAQTTAPPRWVLALHGGAGTIPKDMDPALVAAYRASLLRALDLGKSVLARDGASLDAVEAVVRFLEDDSLFNAGKGAVYTHDGAHELDAAIMNGATLACGSVAGVRSVQNPIGLARLVMEKSPHVFLIGAGAEAFARAQGVAAVDNRTFDTRRRWEQWQKALEEDKFGTVGCVALDVHGHLAAATSTGGLTNKRWGRVGDVPIIGAGTYANDLSCAVSCTGQGEQFIRNTVARDVAARVEYRGEALEAAARAVVDGKLKPNDGGLIAVSSRGEIALVFNSAGMYRGAADAGGRFEVAIWKE
jgi:beta-aspartyl-peptidase (threonine type)